MSLLAIFLAAFGVALSGALMPGPLLTVTLAHAPRSGWRFGPLAVAGHGLLELLLVVAVLLGAGSLLESPVVQGVLGLLGGAILFWMGIGLLRSVRAGKGLAEPGVTPGSSRRAVLLGALVSLSNPYWSLWWATVGLGLLSLAAEKGAGGVAVFFTGHILGDLSWYTAVAFAAHRGAHLAGSRFHRWLLGVCGFLLLALGGWFFWRGAQWAGKFL